MIGRSRQPESDEQDHLRGFDDFDLRLGDVMRGERATLGKSLLDVQRELKIKATYIAAIENCDPSAFETPGFIAGYVRSYSRYLGLDSEWAWKVFCAESGFATAHGMSQAASSKRPNEPRPLQGGGEARDPFIEPRISFTPPGDAFLSRIEPGAIGSSLVLLALIGVIGYGGMAVLKEVQKVQFVPVEQAPVLAADLDPLAQATPPAEGEEVAGVDPKPAEAFDRLYRPQALEVPVLTARDGPIAALDPSTVGALGPDSPTSYERGRDLATRDAPPVPSVPIAPANEAVEALIAEALGDGPETPQVVEETVPDVVLFAVRPSWVRVRSAEGTVLLEKILEPGDTFELPATEEPATLRTGESGALYFAVNGETYGPAGPDGRVTSNISLAADALRETYEIADLSSDSDLRTYVAELDLKEPSAPPAE
ncbi:helix-turn-helix domain-containing protein [Tranquillimonas alkanivorans]|uniref:Protein RodZ, contains Xre-like HTH and DUF4115 domains n=1 Tax=Tranquillimonas alkanivorans TaxID=441119 RepID=A0A1I5MI97_9RHOB|nr:helix-turn-helix domain-containing protein [Tranquillimonas alkanivorans]SFP09239.1 protein RodZ, contains Xre-like HTH and DUF4115 domains [Tranquillimonas alkanivorans]